MCREPSPRGWALRSLVSPRNLVRGEGGGHQEEGHRATPPCDPEFPPPHARASPRKLCLLEGDGCGGVSPPWAPRMGAAGRGQVNDSGRAAALALPAPADCHPPPHTSCPLWTGAASGATATEGEPRLSLQLGETLGEGLALPDPHRAALQGAGAEGPTRGPAGRPRPPTR